MIARALAVLATTAVAVAGGFAASALGLPLPWLLGPLLVSATLAIARVEIGGHQAEFPFVMRQVAVPVIGVMIGSVAPPDIFLQMLTWWPTLLLVLPFIVLVQVVNYGVLRRFGGYDKPTAFFAASAGGLVENVLLGEARGGKVPLMSVQHLGRVALSATLVPIFYLIITGHAVGSAAGITVGSKGPVSPTDLAILSVSGAAGYFIAKALRLPAGIMLGPLLASAAVHAGGITAAPVPPLLVQAAQLVIGLTIGLRFQNLPHAEIFKGLGLSVIAVASSLTLAFVVSYGLALAGFGRADALFLAYSPGGLAEMGLIAISLGASPLFVAMHHLVRIIFSILLAQAIYDRFIAPRA